MHDGGLSDIETTCLERKVHAAAFEPKKICKHEIDTLVREIIIDNNNNS